MPDGSNLPSAAALAATNTARYPNESVEYRTARNALLAEEIELRRHLERVAAQRRALPPGGEVTADYRFMGENGPASLADMFGDQDTLVLYSWMFGPERERPCPMCTNVLGAWDGVAADIRQQVALAVVGRTSIARQVAFKVERGWKNLPMYADVDDAFSRDFHATDIEGKSDNPGFNVFTREGGTVRHFYSGEMSGDMADPGQDPRGAPDLSPLWSVLDMTPAGRNPHWYPKLSY
ncbi:MAG: DUF899 domain-containing protein [Phenylobacterium sp.]|uniref:DUF899 family protein n=1 Tax=Phenylobacterium sp. TaxID=1871053 RepID=UPI0012147FE1|nr:DUF899 family protein [Phenylobacterium sp.]TAJ71467.1 MAG: DUF899 domain-containing protein [Phenylobacterium sp.]